MMSEPAGRRLSTAFFAREVETVARALLGVTVLVDGVGGVIVETEAYAPHDPAAHTYRGVTARNAVMFGPVGRAYVYRIYGLHWCLNMVAAGDVPGSAVLIRAIEPRAGLDTMRLRRGMDDVRLLCSGPGRLTQAMGIDASLGGAVLDQPPFALIDREREPEIVVGPRIGITKAADMPWRFCIAGSRFLSRPAG